MQFTVLGSGAGLPSKKSNTQSYILDVIDEINQYILIDAGEALQHQILHTNIKPSKVKNIFITHLHGDHIYGLPGFLSSRAHQGGENLPLTIYGPKGLKEWLTVTFEISGSRLNYPLNIIEVEHNSQIKVESFNISVYLLEHTIDSYLYVFTEEDKKGALNTNKLQEIGIKPGPIYADIKNSSVFEYEGISYNTADFIGPDIKGRKISVHGDTRIVSDSEYLSLVDNSDLIVHEATYLDNENEKAHQYFHSEISDVLNNFRGTRYNHLLLSHLSNRYEEVFLADIEKKLPSNVYLAHDFFQLPIPHSSRGNK